MDISAALLSDRSKENINRVADYVTAHPKHIRDLLTYIQGTDPDLRLRAAWAFSHLADRQPSQALPYLHDILVLLDDSRYPHGIRRCLLRTIQELDLPEDWQGPYYDFCFAKLTNPKAAVAVRAYSMTICTQLALAYPDLAHELITAIQDHLPAGTAAFKARARRHITQLTKRCKS